MSSGFGLVIEYSSERRKALGILPVVPLEAEHEVGNILEV